MKNQITKLIFKIFNHLTQLDRLIFGEKLPTQRAISGLTKILSSRKIVSKFGTLNEIPIDFNNHPEIVEKYALTESEIQQLKTFGAIKSIADGFAPDMNPRPYKFCKKVTQQPKTTLISPYVTAWQFCKIAGSLFGIGIHQIRVKKVVEQEAVSFFDEEIKSKRDYLQKNTVLQVFGDTSLFRVGTIQMQDLVGNQKEETKQNLRRQRQSNLFVQAAGTVSMNYLSQNFSNQFPRNEGQFSSNNSRATKTPSTDMNSNNSFQRKFNHCTKEDEADMFPQPRNRPNYNFNNPAIQNELREMYQQSMSQVLKQRRQCAKDAFQLKERINLKTKSVLDIRIFLNKTRAAQEGENNNRKFDPFNAIKKLQKKKKKDVKQEEKIHHNQDSANLQNKIKKKRIKKNKTERRDSVTEFTPITSSLDTLTAAAATTSTIKQEKIQ